MRCPRCGFVGFDDQPRCKNCGFDLDAFRRGETIARASWIDRLRGKTPAEPPPAVPPKPAFLSEVQRARQATTEDLATRRDQEREERGLLAQERQIREEGARLRRAYAEADAAEQVNIQAKLADLDQARQRLRREMEDYEARKKAHEVELREKLTREKRAAQAELARAKQMQEEIASELRGAREARLQAETELQVVAETKEKVQAELVAARREQERIDEEMRRAREVKARMEVEFDDARRRAEEEARRQTAEVRAQTEKLIEEAKRQAAEEARREAAEEAKRVLDRERLQARVLQNSADSDAARRAGGGGTSPVVRLSDGAVPGIKPAVRAEDMIEVLGRPRKRPTARPPSPPPGNVEPPIRAEVEAIEEEYIEEVEWEDTGAGADEELWGRTGPYVVPKGGLIFRMFAGLIDLALLLAVVGVFVLIGRMAAGSRIPDVVSLLVTLGLPFYVLFVLLAAAYFTYMHGAYGQTLGKRLLGIKALTTHGEELGYLTAFLRFVAACFAVGMLGMGVVWIALDPNKQGWHDKLARTVVVRL